MTDERPQANEDRNPTKALLIGILRLISPSLGGLAKQDNRFGAAMLYGSHEFLDITTKYYVAVQRLLLSQDDHDLNELRERATLFAEFVKKLLPQDQSRMLTALRQRFGGSFSQLYKNTKIAIKLSDDYTSDSFKFDTLSVPDQQPSPIYTKIEENRLVLNSGKSLHPLLRKEGITETRRYLNKELRELADALKTSNIDRKYVDTFSRLTELIDFKDDSGAITFGLHARQVSQLTKNIEQELSDIQSAKISSILTHSAYFASQYKDWVDFIHNAQSYPSRMVVDQQIDGALSDVASVLIGNADTVDSRIPKSLRAVQELLDSTPEDRTNAIYAGIRGVENICISAIRYAYDQAILLLQDAGKKARPTIVGLGAAAIIGIALKVIATFMPVIVNASELSWILENLPKIDKISRLLK